MSCELGKLLKGLWMGAYYFSTCVAALPERLFQLWIAKRNFSWSHGIMIWVHLVPGLKGENRLFNIVIVNEMKYVWSSKTQIYHYCDRLRNPNGIQYNYMQFQGFKILNVKLQRHKGIICISCQSEKKYMLYIFFPFIITEGKEKRCQGTVLKCGLF